MSLDRRWVAVGLMSGATMVLIIDSSILNVAIPRIATDLEASTSQLQWILDSYTLVFAGVLLTGGALADRFGRVRILMTGLLLFGLASAVAAGSQSATVLVWSRAVMGIGAAFASPASLSIVSTLFDDPRRRANAIATWSAIATVGVALGPIAGGLLLEHFWWGSVFLVNVPTAAVIMIAAGLVVPESRNPQRAPLDPMGAALSLIGLTILIWALIDAPERGWLDPVTLSAIAAGVAMLALFAVWEQRTPHPMFDVAVLRNPRFTFSTLAVSMSFFAIAGLLFVVTQFLQLVLDHDALEAGVLLLPLALGMIGAGMMSSRVVRRFGGGPTISTGLVLDAVACVALATLDQQSSTALLLVPLAMFGVGQGLILAPGIDLAMAAVPPERAGSAAGSSNALRQVGLAIGVAICGSVLASAYRAHLDDRAASLASADRDETARSIGTAIRLADDVGGARGAAIRDMARDAYVSAIKPTLLVVAGVALVGAGATRWGLRSRTDAARAT